MFLTNGSTYLPIVNQTTDQAGGWTTTKSWNEQKPIL